MVQLQTPIINSPGTPADLDGNPRVVELPGATNNYGPLDLDAYETQLVTVLSCAKSEKIFCNGFESQ